MDKDAVLPILLLVVIVFEFFFPAQRGVKVVSSRRIGNIALFPMSVVISAIVKSQFFVLLPLLYFDFGQGLLSPFGSMPVVQAILAFLALDLSMYVQHRLLHTGRFFWSLHALHHSDSAVDFTTYFRHHPLETLISGVMTLVIAIILGVTPSVFAIYLLINNVMQLIQHSNISSPIRLRWIEWFFVTPAFHAQHHSVDRRVSDTNFSTVFTVWDKIFGTYSKEDNRPARFGISGFEDQYAQSIGTMMAMPALVYTASRRFTKGSSSSGVGKGR